jgi:uncharacterized Zn finger protein (UPF0148 family)
MATFLCPSCGGTIEYTNNNQDMTCPFCGTAITTPSADSNATVIVPKMEVPPAHSDSSESAKTVIQQSRFQNSAEIMDEVKRSLREDDKEGAIRTYSKEFNVPVEDARASVEQIEIDMKHSGKEVSAPAPEPAATPAYAPEPSAYQVPRSDVLDAAVTPPPSNNNTRNIIIGCSIAFVLFCCLCIIIPSIVGVLQGSLSGMSN